MIIEEKYMRRALQLARLGRGSVSPNPMVGAVIVADGRIIGEGFHRRFGEGHAEVNAVASVSEADSRLLPESTIYVTLEPCSHYGKTPPCSKLIIDRKIPRVVICSLDPFKEVSGRGIRMLRDAGCEVVSGVLEEECKALNAVFMTAHTRQRPYVIMKWAESSDHFVDRVRSADETAEAFSTPKTLMLSHKLRTEVDAIMVGAHTVRMDNPSLTARHWSGRQPLRVVVSSRGEFSGKNYRVLSDGQPTLLMLAEPLQNVEKNVEIEIVADLAHPIQSICSQLYKRGVTSLLVEGGPRLQQQFLDAGLWDEIRVEQSSRRLGEGVKAVDIPQGRVWDETVDGNRIVHIYRQD